MALSKITYIDKTALQENSIWGGQGGGIAMESSNKTSIINTTAGWSLGSPSTSQYGNTVTALGGNTDSTTNLQPYITCYMWKRIG